MTFSGKLRHFFTPHHTNNFRARLLHNSGIFAIIGIVIVSNIFLRLLDSTPLHILGFTSSVTIDEVVRATNEKRAGAGLKPLSYNERLADAARRKAANMFSENYWAHNSPSGKTPWVWFKEAGYNYVYAGENLAKDFGSTDRMMDAWMASPTHKENIVNPKYSELGIAVVPGALGGQDTVLVVQLFGSQSGGTVTAPETKTQTATKVQVAEVKGQETTLPVAAPSSPLPRSPAKYNRFNLTRTINLATTLLFILTLIVDLFIAQSQKLSRRVGNNWAHIIFINFILLATVVVNAGRIM
ncbi:MAG: CAP domain-containing protein [Microgenomates group bacterium]